MELNLEEQTLLATYRSLDELGKKNLLRHASQQHKDEASASNGEQAGQCRLERREERPENITEPIFT